MFIYIYIFIYLFIYILDTYIYICAHLGCWFVAHGISKLEDLDILELEQQLRLRSSAPNLFYPKRNLNLNVMSQTLKPETLLTLIETNNRCAAREL